jgi:hypothetical protein
VLALVIALSSGWGVAPVCACVSVDDLVQMDLRRTERLLEAYAGLHGGRYPTFAAFEELLAGEERLIGSLTMPIDYDQRAFGFAVGRFHLGAMGYGVSPSGSDYVLLGVSKGRLSMWGVELPWPEVYRVVAPGQSIGATSTLFR